MRDNTIKRDEKRGTYYFVISAGYKEDGTRRQIKRSGFRTIKLAKLEYNKIISDLETGNHVDLSHITLGEYLIEWLEDREVMMVRSSHSRYRRLIQNNIVPVLGHLKIQEVKPKHIQKAVTYYIKEMKLVITSVQLILIVLKHAFKKAMGEKLVKENPVLYVERPKVKGKTKHTIWNKGHIQEFLALRREPGYRNYRKNYTIILTALLTGMRRGEVLGLQWEDINLKEKTLTIRRILDDLNSIEDRTKTVTSTRTIIIPDLLVSELEQHLQFQMNEKENYEKNTGNTYNPYNLVFCTRNGKPTTPATVTRLLRVLTDKSNLPKIRFHDLRHSHASLLVQENQNIKGIQQRLGHANISETLDTYTQVGIDIQQPLSDKFDELFTVTKM
ncbi:site-specific integrase [Cytobacillus suaedae]|nr:site-specific integrase [Cytobacillus suaedae]